MALPEDEEKAHWNELEVSALIDYFYQHRSEVGEEENFRAETYDAAAENIALHLSQGPKKTGRRCEKQNGLRYIKRLYTAIEDYRNQSGFHWDNVRGAGIEGDAAASVWTTYTQQESNNVLLPYRNHGLEHYDKVQEIIPSPRALGTHVFHPSLATAPSLVDDEYDEGFDDDDDEGVDDEDDEGEDASAAIALIGLQGSINRFTDILIKSMTAPDDLATPSWVQAVKRVQDVDDGLSTREKVELIKQFHENEDIAGTYLLLTDQAVRQAWIRIELESVFGGTAM